MKTPQFNVLLGLATLFITASVVITGCGQYGDLYLPPETPSEQGAQDDAEKKDKTETPQPEDL